MIRVYIVCEGSTEEKFTNSLLIPYFDQLNISITPINQCGVVTYGKLKKDLQRLCKQDPSAWVTTFIDYYGFPKDCPFKKECINKSSSERAVLLENAFQKDIKQQNFIAHLTMHEFEGLLFSEPNAFLSQFDSETVQAISKIVQQFSSPEDINDGLATAPSKRIQQIRRDYDKVRHGSLISSEISLEKIRQKCPLFNAWLEKIENLNT